MRTRWPVLLCALFLFGDLTVAHGQDDPLTIRVESRRVLVPVTALHYSCPDVDPRYDAPKCYPGGDITYDPCNQNLVPAKDFRLYQDGAEQKIEAVEIIKPDNGIRRDNLGVHTEGSGVPGGIWSAPDVAGLPSFHTCPLYMVAYKPPATPEGSYHKIRVKVSGDNMDVHYRDQYCNVEHSSADPAGGMPIETKLENYIASGKPGSIHPSAEASYFYLAADKARANVDIEFPLNEVEPKKCSDEDRPFNLLIIAYDKSGNVAARHSEFSWARSTNNCQNSKGRNLADFSALHTPSRFDAQMDLPAGVYRFAVAVSQGAEYGITQAPLTIDDYDASNLAISSIALCKRFRQAGQPPAAKDFIPLISNNYEFTPAADHVFHKGESVAAYFEVYKPKPDATPVQFQMKITNTKTGHVALDTGPMSADPWMKMDNTTIPVSVKLVMDKLVPGDYKLEIQAWGSSGNPTPWRAADFSIQ